MTTSSAEPDRLEAYPGQLASAHDELTTLATDVDEASAGFAAGAGPYGGGFDAAWAGDLVRGLRDESQHLSGWVAGVGAAFREAARLGIAPEKLDNFISKRVGEPTIWEAQKAAEGQAAAEALQAELLALGINPDEFDPAQLWALYQPEDQEQFERIYALMAEIGTDMSSEDFAVGFYDSMDTEGIRVVMGVIDTFAATGWQGRVRQELLEPFARGWANASGSVDLTEESRELLDTDDPVEQRQLALLMTGPAHAYDPEWLADAAERILVTGADLNRPQYPSESPQGLSQGDYPGFADWGWLYDDPALAAPELIATAALDGNVEASWRFASRGDDHVEVLVRPGQISIPSNIYTAEHLQELQATLEDHAGGAIENAFLEAPLSTVPDPDDPTRQIPMVSSDESAAAYDILVAEVGEGDVPDVIKRAVARTLLPHLHEIGDVAVHDANTPEHESGGLFERGEVVAFFKELGWDEEAAAIVGEGIGVWSTAVAQDFVATHPHASFGDLETAFDPVGLVTGTVYQGFNETENAMGAANNALAFGIQQGSSTLSGLTLSAPIIGFIVAGPPGAGAGAALAGGTQLINLAGGLGAQTIRTRDVDLEFDGNDVQRMLVTNLREQLVFSLEDAGLIPDGTPPEEYSAVLADYYGTNDPIDEVDQDSFKEAFSRDPDEPW
ncbi:MAG: hypothetical protein ACRD0A_06925 [Acidimicrobiales bacterium]